QSGVEGEVQDTVTIARGERLPRDAGPINGEFYDTDIAATKLDIEGNNGVVGNRPGRHDVDLQAACHRCGGRVCQSGRGACGEPRSGGKRKYASRPFHKS